VPRYTLHGVVYESTAAGRTPVIAVEVYCDRCGPEGHSVRFTDGNGYYSFDGVGNGQTEILLAKRGYRLPNQPLPADPDAWMGALSTLVEGDTRVDVEVIRR
jgi:hypothetical protein